MNIYKNIRLCIDGMGIVIYSNKAMNYVHNGEDFFETDFSSEEKVAKHINNGDIIGFCTGTSGEFNIKVRSGHPTKNIITEFPIMINLYLNVKGNTVSFIDLFWLMEWEDDVPSKQQISIEEGLYSLIILTKIPNTKIWGDNQDIYIYFNKTTKMSKINKKGIPNLFSD